MSGSRSSHERAVDTVRPMSTDDRPGRARLLVPATAQNEGAFSGGDWVLFLAIATIWGSSFLLIDIGLDSLAPGLITFLRVAAGAAALVALGRRPMRVDPEDRRRLLVLSLIWVAVPFTLFPLAEQHINSAITGLLNGAMPIFAALVATVLLRQVPTALLASGLAIGFAGVVLISVPSVGEGSSQALGVSLVLAATMCYGFAINLAAPLQQRYGSVPLMRRMLLLATVWTAPFGLWGLRDSELEAAPVVAVLALGVVGTGLAFVIMGSLVGRVGSTRAAFSTYLIPVVSLVLGVTFRDDEVAAIAVAGIAFVIAGALIAGRARLQSATPPTSAGSTSPIEPRSTQSA